MHGGYYHSSSAGPTHPHATPDTELEAPVEAFAVTGSSILLGAL